MPKPAAQTLTNTGDWVRRECARIAGAPTFETDTDLSTAVSTTLAEPERPSHDLAALGNAESDGPDQLPKSVIF
jgi:hypothetical protein